jgi:hypothetical protein
MSSIVIQGDTSGSITVEAPSVAGTNTLTLPASTGIITTCVVQKVNFQDGSHATGTTTVPIDNTIMQNTEGDQYLSLAITPTSATNKLRIEVQALLASNALVFITGSIFQDSTANALATSVVMQTSAVNQPRLLVCTHTMTAGTTSATTFKFRAGGQIANTTSFNGTAGASWGGVGASSITITEYAT